tara:strand:+ start:2290 stop:5577 length:3288 start_codon:yes stop_codon:yes gene_type:complete
MNKFFFYFHSIIILISCSEKEIKLFEEISPKESGIDFENNLFFKQDFNIFTYRNYYNGGGVGLGDINNDGLLDIYFTSNLNQNKLYLNKGNFQFEDITETAKVGGTKSWSTGVSIVDINSDGFLDIYVSNSGDIRGDNKQNELFINNGDLTFTEKAKDFGLDDRGYSTHAAFFDYDKDGDLDCYLLNNSYKGGFRITSIGKDQRPVRDEVGGDKLFLNDNGKFIDVSEKAGIYGSVIGFGLGVTVGDANDDGWMDIYVSNDFFERDYLYLNNKDGTFSESLEDMIKSISAASMGADMADINNDGFSEIFVTDMLPEPDERIKTVTTFDSWDRHQFIKSSGYWNQFTRNTLQLNNGNSTFSEIGRLAGVEATDWSWGALMFDFQNDGNKDIFVANGIYQDLTDQDFLQYVTQDEVINQIASPGSVDFQKLIDLIPSVPISNYAFENRGDLDFKNETELLGLSKPSFSNGSAYGDLDNDGDYDLIVNNVNMKAFVYRNNTEILYPQNSYVKIKLVGDKNNINAIGSSVTLYSGKSKFYLEQMPIRGFQSTVDNNLIFGVGDNDNIDSLLIRWHNGSYSKKYNILKDTLVSININDESLLSSINLGKNRKVFTDQTNQYINHTHKENNFVDFDRDRLLFHMSSSEGSCICEGDINNDGFNDLYIGGAKGSPGVMFIYNNSKFIKYNMPILAQDKESEDTDCVFFDADSDGFLDLYVTSGGSEFSVYSTELRDRLYFNKKNYFIKSEQILPAGLFESSSVVKNIDIDKDGDQDLFVGTRLVPQKYGLPSNGYILKNDGKGNFIDETNSVAPDLNKIGMITDASFIDYENDGDNDLLVVGHWMPIRLLENNNGVFKIKKLEELDKTNGWWNTIEVQDINNDGLEDFIVGNHGNNSRFRASLSKPISMYVNDFDDNNSIEQVIFQYNGDSSYTVSLRHDLVMQMPTLKKKYLKYNSYKNQTVNDIFPFSKIKSSQTNYVYNLKTSLFINNNGNFNSVELPIQSQFSTVHAIEIEDINKDGIKDIILGGNLYDVKPEVGRYDANYGQLFLGGKDLKFNPISSLKSGLLFKGQVRGFSKINSIDDKNLLLVLNNNDTLQTYSY